jgi:hypothetical protein
LVFILITYTPPLLVNLGKLYKIRKRDGATERHNPHVFQNPYWIWTTKINYNIMPITSWAAYKTYQYSSRFGISKNTLKKKFKNTSMHIYKHITAVLNYGSSYGNKLLSNHDSSVGFHEDIHNAKWNPKLAKKTSLLRTEYKRQPQVWCSSCKGSPKSTPSCMWKSVDRAYSSAARSNSSQVSRTISTSIMRAVSGTPTTRLRPNMRQFD